MKSTKTTRFEEVKRDLIDNVVNTLEEYKEVIKQELNDINNRNHIIIRNNFNIQLSKHRLSSKIDEIEPLEVLNMQLDLLNNSYSNVKMLIDSFKRFHEKYIAYSNAISDLVHFYEVSGLLKKETHKIRQFNKCLKPITEGTSDKADLKPLLELEGAFNAISDFKKFKKLDRVKYLLKKDEEGNVKKDENGQYIVDRDYFIDRYYKLNTNLRKKYEINQRAIVKLYSKHNTSNRLKRYLEFGIR
ncbi:hypothetical protein [Mammaliicoccus sp. M-M49]|uniref:hypothetical protein n=1 Tax=Mammaliicoccus sp. M-M49 TaxID=2898708 RepID=UPI001EFB8C1B|nr:hypothetical protein [Mammaliicoccus sp. M-M49]